MTAPGHPPPATPTPPLIHNQPANPSAHPQDRLDWNVGGGGQTPTVLILGGTTEARELAAEFAKGERAKSPAAPVTELTNARPEQMPGLAPGLTARIAAEASGLSTAAEANRLIADTAAPAPDTDIDTDAPDTDTPAPDANGLIAAAGTDDPTAEPSDCPADCLSTRADRPAARADGPAVRVDGPAAGAAGTVRQPELPAVRVVTSLAGRTTDPARPPGEVRIGGFGGVDGLVGWLRAEQVVAVVDATHPFAERISATAAEATARLGVPLLALRRPDWQPGPGDDWRQVDSLAAAAELLTAQTIDTSATAPRRVLLTVGRQGVAAFANVAGATFTARCVQPPEPPLPPDCELLLARGPFTVDGERALLRQRRIDILVTKNSGGAHTEAKLIAARELGIPVIMVTRPTATNPNQVATIPDALTWLSETLS